MGFKSIHFTNPRKIGVTDTGRVSKITGKRNLNEKYACTGKSTEKMDQKRNASDMGYKKSVKKCSDRI